MKRLFNVFMENPDLQWKALESSPESVSSQFNAWMMATMNRPTEFANAFMVRKWLNKLTA